MQTNRSIPGWLLPGSVAGSSLLVPGLEHRPFWTTTLNFPLKWRWQQPLDRGDSTSAERTFRENSRKLFSSFRKIGLQSCETFLAV